MKKYDQSNVNSFLKAMVTVVAALHGSHTHSLYKDVKEWAKDADPFVKAYRLARPFTKLFNKFTVSEESVTLDDIYAVGNVLKDRAIKESMKTDREIHPEQRKIINWIRVDLMLDPEKADDPKSQNSYKQLMKVVSTLGEPKLTAFFVPEGTYDEEANIKKAKAMAKKHIGVDSTILSREQVLQWKTKDPKSFAAFLKITKNFRNAYKTELVQLFRKSGKALLDYDFVVNSLTAKGVSFDLPQGYKGQIDEKGRLYTSAGLVLKTTPRHPVRMNTNYDPAADNAYVCFTADPVQHYYTENYKKKGTAAKFEKVAGMADQVEPMKAIWRKLFNNPSMEDKALSVLFELCNITAARIGSGTGATIVGKGTADQKKVTTYGLRTLLCKHVKTAGNGIKIQYPAKDNVLQTFDIEPKGNQYVTRVVSTIQKLMKGKGPNDPVFSIDGKEIPYSTVQNFVKTKLRMPPKTGVHKFRHIEATALAKEMFANCPLKKGVTQKEAEAWLKVEAQKIGDKLGHTTKNGTMALNAYIDPSMPQAFFDKYKLHYPNWLEALLEDAKKGKKKDEGI